MKNKKTPVDPILAEAHASKDAISAEFNYDVEALCRHLRKMEQQKVTGPAKSSQTRKIHTRHRLQWTRKKLVTR